LFLQNNTISFFWH